MSEPKGKCRIVAVIDRGKEANKVAVYARVVVEDSVGQRFYFDASSFNFDLRPLEDSPLAERPAAAEKKQA